MFLIVFLGTFKILKLLKDKQLINQIMNFNLLIRSKKLDDINSV